MAKGGTAQFLEDSLDDLNQMKWHLLSLQALTVMDGADDAEVLNHRLEQQQQQIVFLTHLLFAIRDLDHIVIRGGDGRRVLVPDSLTDAIRHDSITPCEVA